MQVPEIDLQLMEQELAQLRVVRVIGAEILLINPKPIRGKVPPHTNNTTPPAMHPVAVPRCSPTVLLTSARRRRG